MNSICFVIEQLTFIKRSTHHVNLDAGVDGIHVQQKEPFVEQRIGVDCVVVSEGIPEASTEISNNLRNLISKLTLRFELHC